MNLDAAAFVAFPELIQALKAYARPVDCSQDRILFLQGDEPVGLYILDSGTAKVAMVDGDGERILEMIIAPGSLLGLPGVVGNTPYTLSAVARAGAKVHFVPRQEFSSLMMTKPELAMLILQVLAAQVRTARIAACKGWS